MVRLSTERKLQLTALFRAFDYDSSASIEPQEFLAIGKAVKAASAKGGEWTEEMNAKALARVDSDGGGSIDVDEFCGFFEKNMPKNRTQEQFNNLMTRYMAAAIKGRASYYFEEGSALRESQMSADAPESHKFIAKQQRHLKRRCQYSRAAEYAAEYASEEKSLVRQRRQAKAAGNYFCEPEAKLMFVIRIRGMCDMHPKTKKILQLLRLRQIHLGVFLRVNKAPQEMIKRVEPYIAFGYPSLKATRELIYKRGFGKKKTAGQAQRVTLNCNDDIEAALGEHGINCFEDLIHEIYTVGPAFKQANNFLWPFKLNSAKGGLPKKRLGFNEGGQCGNREQYMSSLIFRML